MKYQQARVTSGSDVGSVGLYTCNSKETDHSVDVGIVGRKHKIDMKGVGWRACAGLTDL